MSATAEKASTCTHTLMDATCFFLYIWIYTIQNCVQHRYCFSAVKGFQAQILWSQKDYLPWLLRTCSSVCCTRQKKPSGLTLWKTNGEKIFSPRQPGYRSSGHCPWPIFRTTPCSRHIHIEFDCWHGHFLCKYWRIVLPCNLVCARWPSSSILPPLILLFPSSIPTCSAPADSPTCWKQTKKGQRKTSRELILGSTRNSVQVLPSGFTF